MITDLPHILMLTVDTPYIDRRILLEAGYLADNGFRITILSPVTGEQDLQHSNISYLSFPPEKGQTSSVRSFGRFF